MLLLDVPDFQQNNKLVQWRTACLLSCSGIYFTFPFFLLVGWGGGGGVGCCTFAIKTLRVILGFNFLFFTVGLWVTAFMPIRTITLVLLRCEISTYRRLRSAIVGVIAFMPVDHRLKSSESLKSALEG